MKLLIVSDSHGDNAAVTAAIKAEAPDMLIHLGDLEEDKDELEEAMGVPYKPCIFIKGNCDGYFRPADGLLESSVFELCGHRFFASHGHRQSVSSGFSGLFYTAAENDCDIALFGHIHVPVDEEWEGIRILNPGSISRPRGGSKKSYLILEMDEGGEYTASFKELK
ncbi:MAG: metallophosphoesterase [Lachnospiraceae bacterium]|nr:metallophosphoesterase [Lachnospiraceae bacterium]